MSVYGLRDPRDSRIRYVGRSSRPGARFRTHTRRAHSKRLRDWISELRSLGLTPELALLEGGSEREWIVRLRPDLNVFVGEDDCGPAPDEVPVTIRFPKELHGEATEMAKADERSFNLYIVRAVRAQVDEDKKRRGGR